MRGAGWEWCKGAEEAWPLGLACMVAYFTSLEAWAHRHATHERIMTSSVGMVRRFNGEPGFLLWHEVTVFTVDPSIGRDLSAAS